MDWQRSIITQPNEPCVPSAWGKKNWLFFGNDHGGNRGTMVYSLIETCKLNGINSETYLRHILSLLPEWPANRVSELLPWNVERTTK
ncbi:transposase domain-containing protein [Salmonella enterica]|nr:transposase domain-containing protein [Salmonella enterica]EAB6034461.1 transposase domain-containing protein [Salmonella enterica subsp. enterica serovar Java]EAW1265281.1 transposase domain-containing protein [Salmonella enterica subsp. diarizonae]ECT8551407.1 transposase domain-containing protein [Salmonella enterica subsp. diarizonae serovar 48:i:z]ESG62774.1 hypothetical protein SEEM1594_19632 [Salmonella enterica subsp. enterica serovar Muenchen str. baa1594]